MDSSLRSSLRLRIGSVCLLLCAAASTASTVRSAAERTKTPVLRKVGDLHPAKKRVTRNAPAVEAANLLDVWPRASYRRLSEIGHNRAIIFSPDISSPDNRLFYTALGFTYYEDTSWARVLNGIRLHNKHHPDNVIDTVILETHGTNGEGLKLQTSYDRDAGRSYVSIGGLQEKLSSTGVRYCVITACNAGRLYRPEIYARLNAAVADPLFLPARDGIINASSRFKAASTTVAVLRRKDSHLEKTSDGELSELSPHARMLIAGDSVRKGTFVVSDMFVQLLFHDSQLHLVGSGFNQAKSRFDLTEAQSEALFQRFIRLVNSTAELEYRGRENKNEE